MAENSRRSKNAPRHYDRERGISAARAYLVHRTAHRYDGAQAIVLRKLEPLLRSRDIEPGKL